ncbi:MAG: hypothetical protein OXI53_00560 [Nitrospira sp.]|nr:hypothetical protein [Nitrospira sp.]MDE0403792.1 hypothetical protein [Nitrospira sp.]MDE0486472.1 hypothetical protein [Nitrospira sp.]
MTFSESGLRWFRHGVTLSLIVICNLVLLSALWVSGLDLDFVLTNSELYDPKAGHCVGVAWAEVTGVEGPIRVCSEWLDTTDPTGRVHTLRVGEPLAMSDDGNLYYENARNADHWVLGLLLFAVGVIYLGMRTKRVLLTWYETHLRRP